MANKKLENDFEKNALIMKTIEAHGQNLSIISERLSFLENRVGSAISFADTFHEAHAKTKKIDEVMSCGTLAFLKNSQETKEIFYKYINEWDRSHFKVLINKAWNGFLAIFIFIMGIVVTKIFEKIM